MNDSTHRRRDPSPSSQRKRSHQCDDVDERRVRRRSDDYRRDSYTSRDRSRSPRPRSSTRHHHRSHRARHASTTSHQVLPFNARQLSRSADLDTFRPLLARYLDVQKRIDIATLDERELRGRWKSFVGKWNNGELAEGWYRPETFEDVMLDFRAAGDGLHGEKGRDIDARPSSHEHRRDSSAGRMLNIRATMHENGDAEIRRREDSGSRLGETDEEDEDDDYGPTLPNQNGSTDTGQPLSQSKHGPGIPTISDLTLRRELQAADLQDARDKLRQDRKADRALQKERLEDLAPRAEAGSRERRLEKKREVRDSNAAFSGAKTSNEAPELADAELMGGGGGIEEYKRMRREAERRKTEREVRREEIVRAKREERDERVREYRAREAHTVDMLREMARSRFG